MWESCINIWNRVKNDGFSISVWWSIVNEAIYLLLNTDGVMLKERPDLLLGAWPKLIGIFEYHIQSIDMRWQLQSSWKSNPLLIWWGMGKIEN